MSSSTLLSNINKHIQENFWLYIISILCVSTGIILGIYSVKYMGDSERNDLVNYLTNFVKPSNTSAISYKLIFLQSIKNNPTSDYFSLVFRVNHSRNTNNYNY